MARRRRWFPIEKTRLVFQHAVVQAEVIVATFLISRLIIYLLPAWEDATNAVEFYIFIGLVAELGVLLGWDFWRRNGPHALIAA